MSKRHVVATGLGAATPVGLTVKESWENIVAGKRGVAPLTLFDVSDFSVHFGASVKNFDVTSVIPKKDAKKMDTFIHYGIAAAKEAIEDAGLEVTEDNAERIGVVIGSGIGGLPGIEAGYDNYLSGGPRKISPFFVPSNIINMISGNLSIMYGLKGPNTAIVTACSTGTHCISAAGRMIQYGEADVMIAGGAEMATSKTGLGGFAAARALSTRNDDPQAASRPWDKDRDGFVLGDGAGVLVLEEYEHAVKRGANIYAELIGSGMSSDAYHMTMPSQGGEGAARCMKNAMKDAGLNADEIDYINAHGTSTPAGDVAETMAIKQALGDAASKTAVSSTKSMIGHLLGAAGGVEAVFSVLSIRDQVAPPTINLDNPDEACDLDYVPHTARQMPINVAMSNSFGFGGTNGTVIFKKLN
ncbi:beta-ketoacyl-ACP synthase II [Methylophaga sp. OBS1]|uniref:beta-ketoacyl-ACP synthase II n=1 Tax=Methylophaga sp. OBS1 TaxID=2991933 RepID=UPI002253C2CE|nr:beta-ketoacyl-ACP synthase II [Methylophaga sp. OBS1]MCX4191755.1 beta-ketoacyl-ACP synthase II [Methylophaga sp. OBS1]